MTTRAEARQVLTPAQVPPVSCSEYVYVPVPDETCPKMVCVLCTLQPLNTKGSVFESVKLPLVIEPRKICLPNVPVAPPPPLHGKTRVPGV